MNNTLAGLGSEQANLYFYIKNRPPLNLYQNLTSIKKLTPGEISYICEETGNHWRKIFNVYAKIIFELLPSNLTTWQLLRDEELLQNEEHCLVFSKPDELNLNSEKIHIILGKGYAEQLGFAEQCHWLTNDFAINNEKRIIISPYFDYRQLSNIKIALLCRLIQQLNIS